MALRSLSTRTALLVALALTTVFLAPSGAAPGPGGRVQGPVSGEMVVHDDTGPPAPQPALSATTQAPESVAASPPQPYPFHPQAGALWEDLAIQNYVDLAPGATIQDFNCTQHSYDGHTGIDSLIRSFQEQAIGVPVFAALDGVVSDAHDGEPDMNTSISGQPANFVRLDHGGTHETWYFHLKNGSVAVSVGQVVKAGTQLGLTASSGSSTAPHLHFESRYQGTYYEPYAGPCRPGASNWLNQIPIPSTLRVRDFTFSPNAFGGTNDPPQDQAVRVGAFVSGLRDIYFRMDVSGLPPSQPWRIRLVRPDSTVAVDFPGTFANPDVVLAGWFWWNVQANLNQTGTWRAWVDVNGVRAVGAPFNVVTSSGQITNRPPNPVTLSFEPAAPSPADVIFCRVNTSLVTEDPDYQIMRYHYQWTVNGSTVRDVTTAAIRDAIPSGTAHAGDQLRCQATPSDGASSAATASTSMTVSGGATISVFRPSTGTWYVRGGAATGWGGSGDIPVPGDYDGNGTSDIAVFRPSTGTWYVRGGTTAPYGATGDIPVPGDYDGNGTSDIAVFRPSTGTWYVRGGTTVAFGTSGDIAVPGDYDGNGTTDIAVFRPSTGTWYVRGGSTTGWGASGDIPVPGDYDGNGTTDIAVFRPATSVWYVRGGTTAAYGTSGDIPVPGDYDGNGTTDIAVFRPSTGTWFVGGGTSTVSWGGSGDIPLPLPDAIGRAFFSPPYP